MREFLSVLFLISALCAQQQAPSPATAQAPAEVKPEDKCSVEGTIMNSATGEPLAKSSVNLRRTDSPMAASYGATTDSAGHYVISSVDPGKYMVIAQRNGFVTSTYGSKPGSTMNMGTMLNLAAGSVMKKIDVSLIPHGVVTGRVVDEDGEPMPNVQVNVSRYWFNNGRRSLMYAGGNNTNDKGEFRIFGIAPGRYYVSATYRDFSSSGNVEMRGDVQGDYAPVYYPSTTSLQTAMQIDVVAGKELNGIDLRLTRVKLPRISGKITGGPRNLPTQIMLMSRDRTAMQFEGMKNAIADNQGRFTFRGVMPGRYSITARAPVAGSDNLAATATVEVGTQNIENLQLTFAPLPVVAGVLRIEGRQDLGDLKGSGIRVSFQAAEGGPMFFGSAAMVKDDGTFEARNLGPDRYRITFFPQSETLYIKAVRVGTTEVADPILDLTTGGASEITVTLSEKPAQLQGLVKSKDKPAGGATVVLVPEDREKSHLFRVGATDQDGRFQLKGIPPGRYKLFAWESVEPGSWFDPDFLKPFEESGTSLVLSEGAQENKDLKVLQRE